MNAVFAGPTRKLSSIFVLMTAFLNFLCHPSAQAAQEIPYQLPNWIAKYPSTVDCSESAAPKSGEESCRALGVLWRAAVRDCYEKDEIVPVEGMSFPPTQCKDRVPSFDAERIEYRCGREAKATETGIAFIFVDEPKTIPPPKWKEICFRAFPTDASQ